MKYINLLSSLFIVIILLAITQGCKKYLDIKPNQSLVIPKTVQDLQSLLDDDFFISRNDMYAPEISADNYYLGFDDWNNLDEYERRMYIWADSNLFIPGQNNSWAILYGQIYRANIVLENIDKILISANEENVRKNTKGHALFLRAKAFLQLAYSFCPAFDENTAGSDFGVPLRLDPDFNKPTIRSTVLETYSLIITDLKQASRLLPVTPIHVLRPSLPAAYGLLARTYLSMRKYDSAFRYSDMTLQLRNSLMDYNVNSQGVDPNALFPFSRFNNEVIYSSMIGYPSALRLGSVDSGLYDSYTTHDLRKNLFYSGPSLGYFKGSYEGQGYMFGGIATDEIYLMRAECFARKNNKDAALQDLNTLLITRWETGYYGPFTATNAGQALQIILAERRKELVFRSLRWIDIKRLNKEGRNIAIKRILNGQSYILSPNSPKYAMPIPEDVIQLTGIPQNPR